MIKSKFLAIRYVYRVVLFGGYRSLRNYATLLEERWTWNAHGTSTEFPTSGVERSAYHRVKPQTSRQTKIADKSTPVDDYWRSGTNPTGGQRRTKCTFISGTGRRTCKEVLQGASRGGTAKGNAKLARWFLTPNLIVAFRDKLHLPDIHRLHATSLSCEREIPITGCSRTENSHSSRI